MTRVPRHVHCLVIGISGKVNVTFDKVYAGTDLVGLIDQIYFSR